MPEQLTTMLSIAPFHWREMMSEQGADPLLLHGWLSARSVARGLPSPIPEYGGFRVDTNSDAEVVRWVFAHKGAGLQNLGDVVREPRHFLKLCGTADELRSALPSRWQLHPPGYFMRATHKPPQRGLADGYRIEVKRVGMAAEARIFSPTGALAASGYAAEVEGIFIYDRIMTEPEHRRQGLGHVLMLTLRSVRRYSSSTELLVATEDGRALYSTLGWETISPYSTASIVNL